MKESSVFCTSFLMSCERRFCVSDEDGNASMSDTEWMVTVILADCEHGVRPGYSKGTRDMIMNEINTVIHERGHNGANARTITLLQTTARALDDNIEKCLAKGWIKTWWGPANK